MWSHCKLSSPATAMMMDRMDVGRGSSPRCAKIWAYRTGQRHVAQRNKPPSPMFAPIHLLESLFRNAADAPGFNSLKNDEN